MSEKTEQNSENAGLSLSDSGIQNDPQPSDTDAGERLVPVSEAIRYRKRAQAAEKELSELRERHEKQQEELSQWKEQAEAIRAESVSDRSNASQAKTQGVKETRTHGARNMLQTAAKQAAGSGSRSDVQEYLRLRRSFV